MKGGFGRFALFAAIVCALLSAWANWKIVGARELKQTVLTVVEEIQPFKLIPASAVKLEQRQKDAAPPDAITDASQLTNRYARTLLVSGEVVRQAHLVPAKGGNLAARLAVEQAYEMRAMAIQVNASTSVAGTVQEGDPVDILVAIQSGSASTSGAKPSDGGGILSKIIAQRVPVLLVQTGQVRELGSSSQMTVVLQVTPEQAEEIAFAQAQGMIWLITSPYDMPDNYLAHTAGVDLKSFLAKYRSVSATGGNEQ